MNTVFALMLALSPSDMDVENSVQIASLPELQECEDIAEQFMTNFAYCKPLNIRHTPGWETEDSNDWVLESMPLKAFRMEVFPSLGSCSLRRAVLAHFHKTKVYTCSIQTATESTQQRLITQQ